MTSLPFAGVMQICVVTLVWGSLTEETACTRDTQYWYQKLIDLQEHSLYLQMLVNVLV